MWDLLIKKNYKNKDDIATIIDMAYDVSVNIKENIYGK